MIIRISPKAASQNCKQKAQAQKIENTANARGRAAYVIQKHPQFSSHSTPNIQPKPQSSAQPPKTTKAAPTTPLPPIKRIEHSIFTTWETFEAEHLKQASKIDDYLHPGYRSRPSLGQAIRADMEPDAAHSLPYNNAFARVRYARLMGEHLERLALSLPPGSPVFFVTLINRKHAVRFEDAAAFKLPRVTGWVHQPLRGASYVGMVEGAYYSNLDVVGDRQPKNISFHAHMLVWDISEKKLADICDDINSRCAALIDNREAADFRPLQLGEVFGQGLYMSKGQVREYRCWPLKTTKIDREGEITKPVVGFRSRKRPLRICDAVHLCDSFANRRINEFSFAAGEGKLVLRAINQEALAEFRRWESRQPYKIAEERRHAEARSARRRSRRQ